MTSPRFLTILFLGFVASPAIAIDPATLPEDLTKLAKAFPAIYWHASDDCLRETAPAYDGQFQTIEEYLSEYIAEVIEFEEKGEPSATIKLFDPDDAEEHWRFQVKKSGDEWEAIEGWKYFGEEKSMDMFKGDIFLGSMRPFMDNEFARFHQGVEFPPSTKTALNLEKNPNPAPAYETLIGEGLVGSGFHFQAGEKTYLACSLHQFDGKIPQSMSSMAFEDIISVTGRTYKGNDVQVLTYESEALSKIPPLRFVATAVPKQGDAVYCYNFEEPYLGFVVSIDEQERTCSVRMKAPFPAQGNSGSPVVLARTNSVIGVMLTANDSEEATTVGFELLAPKTAQ